MARKKANIEDRITSTQVSLSATVNMGDGFYQKFHYSIEFEVLAGDDVDDLTDQAWERVEGEIQHQIDEAYEFQASSKKGKK